MTTTAKLTRRKAQQREEDHTLDPSANETDDVVAAAPGVAEVPADAEGFGHSIETTSVIPGAEPIAKASASRRVQAKLEISQPGDPDEEEADRIADRVMRDERIARKESAGDAVGVAPDVTAVAGSGGQPLDAETKSFMEPRFGHDFSHVRVHTDSRAAAAAGSVAARAYTLGQDIVFGSGHFTPNTREGRRLIAHELTHTIQQSRGEVRRLRRDKNASAPPASTSPASAPPSTPAPAAPAPSGATKTVTYDGKTLHEDPVTAKQMIQHLISTEGYNAAMAFLDKVQLVSTMVPENFESIFKGQDVEAAKICVKNTLAQRPSVEKDRDTVLKEFEKAAKTKTHEILTESEKRINAERERYGIPAPVYDRDKESQTEVTPREMANNEATKALFAAAGALVPPRKELEALLKKYEGCLETAPNNNAAPGMPAKRIIHEKEAEAAELDGQIKEARHKVSTVRAEKEAQHPLLSAYAEEGESNTASLENIAKGTASQGLAFWRKNAIDELVPMIVQKLANISKVRMALDDGDLSVYSSKIIVDGTKLELGYNPARWESKVIDDKVKDIKDKEFYINLFVGVLAIGLGLIAFFATAGTATAVIATTGSAVLSGGQAIHSLNSYLLAKASAGTDFEKAKSISQEDPSLFWLALDIIAANLDINAAAASFKVIAPAVREAIITGKSPEALGKLGKLLDKVDPVLKQKVLMHLTGAADVAKPMLENLEKTARAQYKTLADSGRLKEIGDVSEEVFVQQMLSGARAQIIISGQAGVLRTGLLTALMQPGNERIAAILKGEVKAIDELIKEHGNWKQLLGMLDQGTPEMRQAAAKLFDRRQSLLPQLEKEFKAKPVSGASTERISDIDLSTYGETAGADLIKAEEYMKKMFGPGWSEALRMNFYTEAGRLTMYEKIMPGLSAAEQAKLLGEVTADAEKLNVAKMIAHAEGNPGRLAEVEAYAKKIGIDIKDPKIQELASTMGHGADVAARNKLLKEIDELMQKYNAAKAGSQEQIDLAKEITKKQMHVNALTDEAYIGAGAGRMTVSGVRVVGHEAYQATLSNLEMIQHILATTGGDIVTASREYEIYKYINRFAEAAESAGAKTQGLDYWKNFSGFVSKNERGATSAAAHVGPKPTGPKKTFDSKGAPKGTVDAPTLADPEIAPVTDQFLKNQYDAWKSFSEQALADVKKIAQDNPAAWTGPGKPIPTPRPAAGAPAGKP